MTASMQPHSLAPTRHTSPAHHGHYRSGNGAHSNDDFGRHDIFVPPAETLLGVAGNPQIPVRHCFDQPNAIDVGVRYPERLDQFHGNSPSLSGGAVPILRSRALSKFHRFSPAHGFRTTADDRAFFISFALSAALIALCLAGMVGA